MIYFTSDEHYFHKNIIEYSNRPFNSLEEMHEVFLDNHNKIVSQKDTTYHLGDYSFDNNYDSVLDFIMKFNGGHVFLNGSHDYWLKSRLTKYRDIIEINPHTQPIVLCHYCMLTWPKSHYGSWHLFGHHHGKFTENVGKSYDVGVDNNQYQPVSFDQIVEIMKTRPDNINLLHK